jgi:hypothetical protein
MTKRSARGRQVSIIVGLDGMLGGGDGVGVGAGDSVFVQPFEICELAFRAVDGGDHHAVQTSFVDMHR